MTRYRLSSTTRGKERAAHALRNSKEVPNFSPIGQFIDVVSMSQAGG